ncbi:MAG: HAMP domain-containing histidine kinase [Anaerolineae bacterium]|nr:HAMP domain-containing histidine kinase [Anaerolineae bacterium]
MAIRVRLTLWYGGILALLLLLFGGALYGILQGSLQAGVDRTLVETAEEVQSSVRRQIALTPALNWAEVLTIPPLDVFAAPDVFVQVRYPNMNLAATSANLAAQELPGLNTADWVRVLSGTVDLRTVEVGDVRLRLRSEPVLSQGRPVAVLQVAASLRATDEALHRLLALLLGGGGLGLVLAVLGGAFLAQQALSPIVRVTETARRIAATEDLGDRLACPAVQDEVGQLITTLNEMLDRLQQLFQGQQRFIADVSHELRTPLTAIRGNLEVLQRGAQADPTLLAESLDDIGREVARLSRMVADVLALARAEAGMRLERRPVELDRLLLDTFREARHLARGVEVDLTGEDQALVLGDADRLKQLLLNLVDNALKYTPAGGTVSLALCRRGTWACLSVADTGAGIPAEELPYIFDRYYRGQGARRRGGMGLGLAIAHWIAQEHGGRIDVDSKVGQGTTFTVWLPLLHEAGQAAGHQSSIANRQS